ncbi:uncharacterized protein [Ciconia boyciana]|uniref:uncharacterized protein isoform X2 n=1 Tax=Ciconia boyciana TaxID=52775 RepID=UPI003BA38CB0
MLSAPFHPSGCPTGLPLPGGRVGWCQRHPAGTWAPEGLPRAEAPPACGPGEVGRWAWWRELPASHRGPGCAAPARRAAAVAAMPVHPPRPRRCPGLSGAGSHPASPGLVLAPTPPCKPAAASPGPACLPFLASGRRRRQPQAADGSARSASGSRTRAGPQRGPGGVAVPAASCVSDSSVMSGKLRRSRRGVLEKRWQSLEERGSAGARLGHPVLARSKTCDPSFCKETERAAAAAGRQGHPSPSLSKCAASYRKAFGELAEREVLLACFSCAWQREVPYHGRLYISSRHISFHSSLLLKDIKVVVPVASISALKKTNTALLVPNALSIRTAEGEKFLFVSLRRREATYQLLKSVCKHLQTSSQSDLEQSTPEPDSLQELPDGPSPTPRQAEEEDEEAAALALSSGTRRHEASKDPAITRTPALAPARGTVSGTALTLPPPLGNSGGLHHQVPSSPPRCLGSPHRLWGSVSLPPCLSPSAAAGGTRAAPGGQRRAQGLAGVRHPPPTPPHQGGRQAEGGLLLCKAGTKGQTILLIKM